ncbi:MAG: ParB/RepB/Spo0J family partition protein [Candidatus Caldarchaeum sp.]|nr:ParB/RepB/Spo0J family partition protein [Candidatus Caldarchaeum sp.]MCS7137234.1 ParB/RepB/Spo0J family partition protein [Candidatus Caldarchaeum sp.]MDW7977354.1 ParB/RepB/Spo0J family partition protein [Candidatus Caldarchaeum sp.]MDW8359685.1 ParB/RepB/Spo0J family partition protein [Candidatus Caldarchaeum sp.]
MAEVVMLEVSKLRRSSYNPRMVQDPERTKILLESVRKHGVKQPLLTYPSSDGFYEVLDGGRRLSAALEAGLDKVPCVVVEPEDVPRKSLTIHLSQEDLTPEEVVVFVERLVEEEVFRSVEEVCRYLGVSRSWFYELKKASKLKPVKGELPATVLALVERSGLDDEGKREVLDVLSRQPVPRSVLKEALKEAAEKPEAKPSEIIERHVSSAPKRIEENILTATGLYTYMLRLTSSTVEFTARKGLETLWTATIPLKDLHTVKRLWQQA